MAASPDELLKDAVEQKSGVDTDVACLDCGEAAIVRFCNGEPLDETNMTCHCGGEMETV